MRARWIIAAVLASSIGLVWIGQGLGILRGTSFMVGDTRWAVVGVVLVVVGSSSPGRGVRRSRRAPEPGRPRGLGRVRR